MQGPFQAAMVKVWAAQQRLPADLLCSVNSNGSLAFEFRYLDAVFQLCDKEHVTPDEIKNLAVREQEGPPGLVRAQLPPGEPPAAHAAQAVATPAITESSLAPQAASAVLQTLPQPRPQAGLAAPVQAAARWGGTKGADISGWVGSIGQTTGAVTHLGAGPLGPGSHDGWNSHGDLGATEPGHDPVDEIIGGFTSGVSIGGLEAHASGAPRNETTSDPWDQPSESDPPLSFPQPAPWDIGRQNVPAVAPRTEFTPPVPAPAPAPLPAPAAPLHDTALASHMYHRSAAASANASPIITATEDDAQSYLTGLGVVLGKPSPVKPVVGTHPPAADPVWKPPVPQPTAPPPPPPAAVSSGPAPWASRALAGVAHGPSLEDIQREEITVHEREQVAAAARAAAEAPMRKLMWAPQAPPPARTSLDAIMDDEENAADLEGGVYEFQLAFAVKS